MIFRIRAFAILPLCLAAGLSPLQAKDVLPDVESVKAFTASDAFHLNGWWRMVDPPSRPTPGSLMLLNWKPDPPASLEIQLLQGSIFAGKGSLAEFEGSAQYSEAGELKSASVSMMCDAVTERSILKLTEQEKWAVDFFGGGKTTTQTADDYGKAAVLVASQSEPAGAFLTMLERLSENLNTAAPTMEKVTAVRFEDDDGKKHDAWRVEVDEKAAYIISRMDGAILAMELSGRTLRRSTPAAVRILRERMKEYEGSKLDPADSTTAHLTFHGVEEKWFSPSRTRRTKAGAGGLVEVFTGIEPVVPDREKSEDLTVYANADAAVTGHAKFGKILEGMEEHDAASTPPKEYAWHLAEQVRQTVQRDLEKRTENVIACLSAGKGDIVAMTKLVMEGCRHGGIPCREIHGFVVQADSLPVVAFRHCWLEILDEGEWEMFDPWLKAAYDDEGSWQHQDITGLHVEVCHGEPRPEQEVFLNSKPAVTISMVDTNGLPWPPIAEKVRVPSGEDRK